MSTAKYMDPTISEIPSPQRKHRLCRQTFMSRYLILDPNIGEGAQSTVVLAVDSVSNNKVAIKQVRNSRHTVYPVTDYFREISVLKYLPDHPCIIKLIDVHDNQDDLWLVFEACEMDLRQYLKNEGPFLEENLIYAMIHLFSAIKFIHEHQIIHRDIKPCNILIKGGLLKIADFGLSKKIPCVLFEPCPMTMQVATLWYRDPCICLGYKNYSYSMDIWSLGCVLYELISGGIPLFPGNTEITMILSTFQTLGTPKEKALIGKLPLFSMKFPKWSEEEAVEEFKMDLKLILNKFNQGRKYEDLVISLILGCLKINPEKRITANEGYQKLNIF
jgi:serine/threonine protein kinase